MREYRRRKRGGQISAPVSLPSTSSIVRAAEPSRVSQQIIEKRGPQLVAPHTASVRKGTGNSLKTTLDLAQSFPVGVLASQVCPYCNNTGYSSSGTHCSSLLQLCVLRLGLLQDGDVGVGVFPDSEEILVGLASHRRIACNGKSTPELVAG